MNVVAIIQARLGSTRLPCKMLLHLHGFAVIDWVVDRVGKAASLDAVVAAIPDSPLDDALQAHLEHRGVSVFRGDEHDVLKRFYDAAVLHNATHIVRVCADNPLIWGPEIDRLIHLYRSANLTGHVYAYNHIPRKNRYPDGLGAEMVSFDTLELLHNQARKTTHREHCLSYIWDHPDSFHIRTCDPDDPRLWAPDVRLDMDTAEDFRRLSLMPVTKDMPPHEVIPLYRKLSGKGTNSGSGPEASGT